MKPQWARGLAALAVEEEHSDKADAILHSWESQEDSPVIEVRP